MKVLIQSVDNRVSITYPKIPQWLEGIIENCKVDAPNEWESNWEFFIKAGDLWRVIGLIINNTGHRVIIESCNSKKAVLRIFDAPEEIIST